MMVIALGRLGMHEFDLASDADLVFVIPDADASETRFWTAVAERMISVISAYTGDGVVFTIDTRLSPTAATALWCRPKAPTRTTSPTTPKAWEGITYMKARAVAGNIERATAFLGETSGDRLAPRRVRAAVPVPNSPRCARVSSASRAAAILSRPRPAAITISISL